MTCIVQSRCGYLYIDYLSGEEQIAINLCSEDLFGASRSHHVYNLPGERRFLVHSTTINFIFQLSSTNEVFCLKLPPIENDKKQKLTIRQAHPLDNGYFICQNFDSGASLHYLVKYNYQGKSWLVKNLSESCEFSLHSAHLPLSNTFSVDDIALYGFVSKGKRVINYRGKNYSYNDGYVAGYFDKECVLLYFGKIMDLNTGQITDITGHLPGSKENLEVIMSGNSSKIFCWPTKFHSTKCEPEHRWIASIDFHHGTPIVKKVFLSGVINLEKFVYDADDMVIVSCVTDRKNTTLTLIDMERKNFKLLNATKPKGYLEIRKIGGSDAVINTSLHKRQFLETLSIHLTLLLPLTLEKIVISYCF